MMKLQFIGQNKFELLILSNPTSPNGFNNGLTAPFCKCLLQVSHITCKHRLRSLEAEPLCNYDLTYLPGTASEIIRMRDPEFITYKIVHTTNELCPFILSKFGSNLT